MAFNLHRGFTSDGQIIGSAETIEEAEALCDADAAAHPTLDRVVCNVDGEAVWLDGMAGAPGAPVGDHAG